MNGIEMQSNWQLCLIVLVLLLNPCVLRADEAKQASDGAEARLKNMLQEMLKPEAVVDPELPIGPIDIDPSRLADETIEKAKEMVKEAEIQAIESKRQAFESYKKLVESVPAELQQNVDMSGSDLDFDKIDLSKGIPVPSAENMDSVTTTINEQQTRAERDEVEVKKKPSLLLKDPMLLKALIVCACSHSRNLVVKRVVPGMEFSMQMFWQEHSKQEGFSAGSTLYSTMLAWMAFEQRRPHGDILEITPEFMTEVNQVIFENPCSRPKEAKASKVTLNLNKMPRESSKKLRVWMTYLSTPEDAIPPRHDKFTLDFPQSGYMSQLPPGHYLYFMHSIGLSILPDETTGGHTYNVYHLGGNLSIKTLSPECAEAFIIASIRWGQVEYQGSATYVTDDTDKIHLELLGPVGQPPEQQDPVPPACRQQ
ncbi:hypothetical protein ACWJJH_03350 [Endozoicomonadaceae bacterium StTr2]